MLVKYLPINAKYFWPDLSRSIALFRDKIVIRVNETYRYGLRTHAQK